jgi:V/A-type H+-transporting ATPase subunit I
MLIAMYNVVLSMIVYNAGFDRVETWHLHLLAVGFGLVFLFGHYQDSIVKSVTTSFSDIISLFLAITGAFSDITSYIRLWAVALAGASIAVTINGLAEPLFANVLLLVFGIVFFAFGHIFNIVLCAMSFLVHGIRLNTLEFSSHLGLEWSGFPFKPFAKRL